MFNCAPLQQLFGTKIMENHYLQRIFIPVANFLFTCLFTKCLPSAQVHALSRARHWLMDGANDALLNAAPNVQLAMAQNITVMLHVISTPKT